MDLKRIEDIARREMATRREPNFREPGWILHHGRRVGRIAAHLARELRLPCHPDLLYAAGLFHDIAKGRERHNEAGAELTGRLLADLLTATELADVTEAIRLHNQRGRDGDLPDAVRLIQDADVLDHAGFVEVWLTFYWHGHHGETFADHEAWLAGQEYARHHAYMAAHLNYEASRRLLARRQAWAERFYADFHHIYREGVDGELDEDRRDADGPPPGTGGGTPD